MRYPIKDKFWGWRMDPFEVFAYWDSRENQPQLSLSLISVLSFHLFYDKTALPTTKHVVDICTQSPVPALTY